jgi:hypothetical protein
MLEQLLAGALQMLAVEDRRLQLVGVEQRFQQCLPLFAQVFALEPEKI